MEIISKGKVAEVKVPENFEHSKEILVTYYETKNDTDLRTKETFRNVSVNEKLLQKMIEGGKIGGIIKLNSPSFRYPEKIEEYTIVGVCPSLESLSGQKFLVVLLKNSKGEVWEWTKKSLTWWRVG